MEDRDRVEDKAYIAFTVGFVIPGPSNTYSSVRVEATYGRHKRIGEDDSDIFAEAMVRAQQKMPEAYKTLIKTYDTIKDTYGF